MNKNLNVKYLKNRENILQYTNVDMNLTLQSDEQIYIAVFDIPLQSVLLNNNTKTLGLVFGLNAHIYWETGDVSVGLEKNKNVMKAMQSLFTSAQQVLSTMEVIDNYEYYESENIRAYLKTRKGVYFKEIIGQSKEERFLKMLVENVLKAIANDINNVV